MSKNFNFQRTRRPQSGTGFKTGLAGWRHDIVGLVRWLTNEFQARVELAEHRRALRHMPVWQLDDLGLSREEAMAEGEKPVWAAAASHAARPRPHQQRARDCGCACEAVAPHHH